MPYDTARRLKIKPRSLVPKGGVTVVRENTDDGNPRYAACAGTLGHAYRMYFHEERLSGAASEMEKMN
jgi:hypothetical protein